LTYGTVDQSVDRSVDRSAKQGQLKFGGLPIDRSANVHKQAMHKWSTARSTSSCAYPLVDRSSPRWLSELVNNL